MPFGELEVYVEGALGIKETGIFGASFLSLSLSHTHRHRHTDTHISHIFFLTAPPIYLLSQLPENSFYSWAAKCDPLTWSVPVITVATREEYTTCLHSWERKNFSYEVLTMLHTSKITYGNLMLYSFSCQIPVELSLNWHNRPRILYSH